MTGVPIVARGAASLSGPREARSQSDGVIVEEASAVKADSDDPRSRTPDVRMTPWPLLARQDFKGDRPQPFAITSPGKKPQRRGFAKARDCGREEGDSGRPTIGKLSSARDRRTVIGKPTGEA